MQHHLGRCQPSLRDNFFIDELMSLFHFNIDSYSNHKSNSCVTNNTIAIDLRTAMISIRLACLHSKVRSLTDLLELFLYYLNSVSLSKISVIRCINFHSYLYTFMFIGIQIIFGISFVHLVSRFVRLRSQKIMYYRVYASCFKVRFLKHSLLISPFSGQINKAEHSHRPDQSSLCCKSQKRQEPPYHNTQTVQIFTDYANVVPQWQSILHLLR